MPDVEIEEISQTQNTRGHDSVDGIIIADKPRGITSFKVVKFLMGTLKTKVGHLGTLDPNATGILPCLVGRATRLVEYLQDVDREYISEILLGVRTDTDDITGKPIYQKDPSEITKDKIEKTVFSFLGSFKQRPPHFSSKKYEGKKLYEYARKNQFIDLPPVDVMIYSIDIISINIPVVKIRLVSSVGMYVRALARDIGEILGCGATLMSLRRIRYGIFSDNHSINFEQLKHFQKEKIISSIMRITPEILNMRGVILRGENMRRVVNGGSPKVKIQGENFEKIAICDDKHRVVAIGHIHSGDVIIDKVISQPSLPL